MKKQSFLYGATVLAAASILCKIMSAVLKIPLDRLFLHEEGIGVYQSAYTIYNVFLAFCVTGIPIALSSLIAGSEEKERASLTKSACISVTVAGIVSGVLLFLFADPLARVLSGGGNAVAAPSLRVLAAALPFMGIISSRRGYFQGKSMMTPSALSQLAESVMKVALGIGLCAVFIKHGISYGAAGAIAGVSVGAVASAAVLEICFNREKNKTEKGKFSLDKAYTVLKISIPMTLGAFAYTAVMLSDTLSVPHILASAGVAEGERLRLFGELTRANTIYNLPATVISAFTASAVPALAFSKAEENGRALGENTVRAIKLVFFAALPCAFGMILFPKEILSLVYSAESNWSLLIYVGVMVMMMPYIQTTTAMLQTLGKVWTPIFMTVLAVAFKIVLNFLFVKELGIVGAPLSTICAFLPVVTINTAMLARTASLRGSGKVLLRLLLCSVVSCGAAKVLYSFTGGTLMLLASVGLAGVMYLALTVVSKCITKSEFTGKGAE